MALPDEAPRAVVAESPPPPLAPAAAAGGPLAPLAARWPVLAQALSFVLPFAGLLLAFTLFSLYTVLMKQALNEGTSPLVLAFLREVFATALLLPLAFANEWRRGTPERFWPAEADRPAFVMLGLAMIWCVQLLSALSLEHLSANTYALLAPTVPVICCAAAIASGYEAFDRTSGSSWAKIGAIIVTVAGAFVIAVGAYVSSPGKEKGNVVLGLGLLVTNKVGVALYPIMEKRLMKRYRAFTVVAWGYAYGAVLVLLSIVPCATSTALWHIGPSGWTSICFSAFVTSAFNYALMAEINSRTSPVMVMAFYPWQSVATPVLSYLILGTKLSSSDGGGGFVICVGLFALAWARWREAGGAQGAHALHQALPEEKEAAAPDDAALPAAAAAAAAAAPAPVLQVVDAVAVR
jgi:drug/metabolite transporter (DMT)-like permease